MMRLAVLVAGLAVVLGTETAWAQKTQTSTSSTDKKSQQLQDELETWESGGDVFDEPFDTTEETPPGPAEPRIQAPPPPPPPEAAPPPPPPPPPPKAPPRADPPPPPSSPTRLVAPPPPVELETTAQGVMNVELYREGERQRSTGRALLISGIVGLVGGSGLCAAGYIGLLSNQNSTGNDDTGFGAMFLGGGVVVAAGTGLVIAGTIMQGRGGRKMRKAQQAPLTGLGPMMIDGQLKGVHASFQF